MANVALNQVSSKFARDNAAKTLDKPVRIDLIARHLDEATRDVLAKACPQGQVFIWGAKLERLHQYTKMLPRSCLVLFRRAKTVTACGVILAHVINEALAEQLWGRGDDGETWSMVYFFHNIFLLDIPAAEVNAMLGRKAHDNWQGLHSVPSGPEADAVIQFVKEHLEGRARS